VRAGDRIIVWTCHRLSFGVRKSIYAAENSLFVPQGMPTSTTSMKFDSEHRRALETMKGDRQKEVEKLKAEAVASASTHQALTQKLDKVTARKSILEQEVLHAQHRCASWGVLTRTSGQ